MKVGTKHQKSCLLLIAFLLLMMLSGCSKEKEIPYVSISDTQEKKVDILTHAWAAPETELEIVEGWDIVQYNSGFATPTNQKLALWMNNINNGENCLYSMLFLEEIDDGKQYVQYEMKRANADNLEIETVWDSLSDLDFSPVWDEEQVLQIEEKLKTAKAAINTYDVIGENVVIFLAEGDIDKNLEHFYKIEIDKNRKVKEITDYVDFVSKKVEGNVNTIFPDMICGKEGELYCVDLINWEITLLDKAGNEIEKVDAKSSKTTLKSIGKNIDGIPIFFTDTGSKTAEFFYIDKEGKHVLYSGEIYYGAYFIDGFGNVLIQSGSRIYSWNVLTGKVSILYDLNGMNTCTGMGIAKNSSGELVVCYEDGDGAFLYRLNNTEHPKKTELVVLTRIKGDYYLVNCANAYMRVHPEVSIVLEESDENDEYAWNKLVNEVKKGNGPDIFYTNRKMLDYLHSAGVICSMEEYVPEEIRNNMFRKALDVGKFESELFAIPCEADLEILMVKNEYWSEGNWTLGEAISAYNKLKEEIGMKRFLGIPYNCDSLKLFLQIYSKNIDYSEFIDLKNNTCNFQTDSFYNLLRFCCDNCDENKGLIDEEEIIEKMLIGDTFLYTVQGGLKTYSEARKELGEEFHAVGYPSGNNSIGIITCMDALAINSKSENKDVASDFISVLLGEEYQTRYSVHWIRKDVISEHVKDAVETHVHTINGIEHDIIPVFEINPNTYVPLAGREDGTSFADEYIYLMDEASPRAVENEISEIIYEESSAYFEGVKTEEEVAKIIQSRVQILLDERK